MLVADRIAQLLQRQGAEHVVGFPENRLIDAAARAGMRPIITRTERVAVNIADGYARACNGERPLPCVTQYGPGAEAAFGAVAQAYGDRSPILMLPTEYARDEQEAGPSFEIEQAYRPITRFAATVNDAAAGPQAFRRALNALSVGNGPVLVAVANDVMNGESDDPRWDATSARPRLTLGAAADVELAARRLTEAANPVILAGQGVLWASASDELVELISTAFRMRRKTLVNNLAGWRGLGRDGAIGLIDKAGLPIDVRAEIVTLSQFATILSSSLQNDQ